MLGCQSITPTGSASIKNLHQVYRGNGTIYDIKTGENIQLKKEKMQNILILPEGYTKAEFDQGVFDKDVEDWIKETERFEPLKSFKDAFIIWKYHSISKTHIVPGDMGKSNTSLGFNVDISGQVQTPNMKTVQNIWEIAVATKLISDDYYPPRGISGNINKNLVMVVLIYDPKRKKSGYSGIAHRLKNPNNKNQYLGSAIARNYPHEFLHAFAMLADEYLSDKPANRVIENHEAEKPHYVINVVKHPDWESVPWKHLFYGGSINPAVKDLIGIYGDAVSGYHSEARCLMNGKIEANKKVFGGDGNLRDNDRLCNWCREIVVFRLYERLHMFTDTGNDFDTWKKDYREKFYARFGFAIPKVIPQVNSDGKVIESEKKNTR